MMSANQYRARAEALELSAAGVLEDAIVYSMQDTAERWRWLGDLADLQDALVVTMATRGD